MVFLIQQSQNKDSVALHLKLNELLAASKSASNRMIGIEDLDEEQLREVANFYDQLATQARTKKACKEIHSRSEEHTSELQSPCNLVCRLLLEKKKQQLS